MLSFSPALLVFSWPGCWLTLSNLEAKINDRTIELETEKKSDALLHSILPDYVIYDLKERGASEPRHFEDINNVHRLRGLYRNV